MPVIQIDEKVIRECHCCGRDITNAEHHFDLKLNVHENNGICNEKLSMFIDCAICRDCFDEWIERFEDSFSTGEVVDW